MKKLVLLMTALLVGSFSFAGAANLSKNSSIADSMAAALKAKNPSGIQLDHDINMVYGGQDVSLKHAGIAPVAIA